MILRARTLLERASKTVIYTDRGELFTKMARITSMQLKKEIQRNREYFWNTAAGVLNAAEAVILSMVVTRTNGLSDAGVLSIAFAVGNLMMTIGKFGVRSYQVTDAEGNYSFAEYLLARILTVVLMAVISITYLAYCVHEKGYTSKKAAIILTFCFIYMVESVEDVFWGLYQVRQALDAGAKIFILRWVAILAVCIQLLVRYKDLRLSSFYGAATGLAVFCVYNTIVFRRFHERSGAVRAKAIRQILCQCFPLFMVSFLMIYITNAPKYAIDRYLSEEIQACYGFIAMPVFVIEMLNGFIYQPSLVQLALEWKERKLGHFRERAIWQCVILLGLMAVCLFGAYLCGIPVLSALYGTDLAGYKAELLVLLYGGGMLAYAGYFGVLLTIMRRQTVIMYGYAGISVLSLAFSDRMVRAYGVMGAAVLYALLMTLLAFMLSIACWYNYRKIEKL